MATRYHLNTDHWSKMRMKIIKNAINNEHRGRVVSWEKHKKGGAQHELEAAIRGTRNLPENQVGPVHNFQDIVAVELDEFLPGSAYFRRRGDRNVGNLHENENRTIHRAEQGHPLMTGSQYTLMTLPTDPQSDQTRSHVPVLQCRGRI